MWLRRRAFRSDAGDSDDGVGHILSGVLGLLAGLGITAGFSQLAGWVVAISWPTVAMAFCFSAAIGLVFGIWPARRAALLNPIQALRYE